MPEKTTLAALLAFVLPILIGLPAQAGEEQGIPVTDETILWTVNEVLELDPATAKKLSGVLAAHISELRKARDEKEKADAAIVSLSRSEQRGREACRKALERLVAAEEAIVNAKRARNEALDRLLKPEQVIVILDSFRR